MPELNGQQLNARDRLDQIDDEIEELLETIARCERVHDQAIELLKSPSEESDIDKLCAVVDECVEQIKEASTEIDELKSEAEMLHSEYFHTGE